MKRYALLFACLSVLIFSCKKDNPKSNTEVAFDNGPTDSLKMNQIQIIASHNSYHLKPDDTIAKLLDTLYAKGILPAQYNPEGIDYAHLPIEQQLNNYTVRGLELDF